jgi:hypothetical protein
MQELIDLVAEIEKNINEMLADMKKTKAPKSAWQRARKMSLLLARQFKLYRSLSVIAAKNLKEKE